MSLILEIADKLALEVIKAAEELDDDRLVEDVAQVIGASSPTTEEAFRTAARVRMAEGRARRFLADRIAKGKTPPEPDTP